MGHVDWERIRRDALAHWSNGLTEQDNAAGVALREFESDPRRGISSSPSIRTWMPQRLADRSWQSPIPWLPDGFWPYEFQARAFARLSVAKQLPRPTAIAAPEGSGKSDCFLLPILDHCARQQGMSRAGIKAVIVYASRAAAQENAARLGSLCSSVGQFHDLRPALLIDDFGSTEAVGPGFVIDSIDAMGDNPPDLLLTVPEMLERSLNTKRHHRVWSETTPVSLRFVVLDDLHFYTEDGVQDLAVLLRRLGTSLGMASPTQPLGGAVPVVTAGIKTDPVVAADSESPNAEAASAATPATPPPPSAPPPPAVAPPPPAPLPPMPPMAPPGSPQAAPSAPSGLPSLPTLPDISATPASGPAGPASGAFARPAIGSLASSADSPNLPGLDSSEEEESEPHDLLDLATYLFGVKFKADSLIVDSTMTPDEMCSGVNRSLPMASFAEVGGLPSSSPDVVLSAMFGAVAPPQVDPVVLGELLCTHPLVERLMNATHQNAMSLDQIEEHTASTASLVNRGVQRVASLLGSARRPVGSQIAPLLRVDSQLSLRPVARLVRMVSPKPAFVSANEVALDHPGAMTPPGVGADTQVEQVHYLPAVACSNCGSSGWLAALLGHVRQVASLPSRISEPLGHQGGNLAILMAIDGPVAPHEAVRYLHSQTLALDSPDVEGGPGPEHIAVRLASGATAVSARSCPVCEQRGVVDLIGADAPKLTTDVTNGILSNSGGGQGRLLVLTDSVESAASQIGALTDDSYVVGLRRRILVMLSQVDSSTAMAVDLPQLATALLNWQSGQTPPGELAPADLREDPRLVSLWSESPTEADLSALRGRIEFELSREFGQRSAEATSLSSSGVVAVRVDAGSLDEVAAELAVKIADTADRQVAPEAVTAYLEGLLDKMRLDGAIGTGLLRPFVDEGGDPKFVTQSRPAGLPELVGAQRPRFVTTSPASGFTSVTTIHQHSGGPRTWLVDWACSTLGINSVDAPAINWFALDELAKHQKAVFAVDSFDGHRVYALMPDAIRIAPGQKSAQQVKPEREDVAVQAASTVGVSSVEKVRTEWAFKYGQPGRAPNVLYMSAGHVRPDRDVVDTTIDMAMVDTIVADADAVRQMGSIPEVRRVGIASGYGTVVLVEPERSAPRSAAGGNGTDLPESTLETSAELPPLPERIRTTENDYFDYLFDRLTNGGIHFEFEFETLEEMMELATQIPEGHAGAPAGARPDQSAENNPGSGAGPKMVEVSGVAVPEIDFSFIPSTDYGVEDKPLFETLVAASTAAASLTKPSPVDDFLRTIAHDHDDDQAERLKGFARDGVSSRLEAISKAWSRAGEAQDATSSIEDDQADDSWHELAYEPWHDGVETLEHTYSGTDPTDDTVDAEVDGEAPSSVWMVGDGLLGVEYLAGPKPHLRLLPPILDIQGLARIESFARAFLLGVDKTPGLDSLVSSGLSVRARIVESDNRGPRRTEVDLTSKQSGFEVLAKLAGPATVKSVLESSLHALNRCSCNERAVAGCENCLLGDLGIVSSTGSGALGGVAEPVVASRHLAVETIESILAGWSQPQESTALPSEVPAGLATRELARGFELALKVWLNREPDVHGKLEMQAEAGTGEAGGANKPFELSMTFTDVESKYVIEGSTVDNSTIDSAGFAYRISPLSGEWPQLELFLEPLDADPDRVTKAVDAARRSGRIGWALGWNDVREFYVAASSADAADVPDRTIMSAKAREVAADLQAASANRIRIDSLEQNPFALMLDVMARPVAADWAEVVGIAEQGVHRAGDGPQRDREPGGNPEISRIWALLKGLS